jgi:hypothetical protein
MPFSVYRFYAPDDALLYVGRSARLPQRIRDHFRDKPWWAEASRIELEHFDTAAEMVAHEAVLIRSLAPRYNIALMPQRRPVVEVAPERDPLAEQLTFTRGVENWRRPRDVAAIFGVSMDALRRWALDEGLPCLRTGRQQRRFLVTEVDAWLREHHPEFRAVPASPS